MVKVAWDVSKQGFTIEDHYYFSKLKRLLKENNIKVEEVKRFKDLVKYDVIVFNYPERRFSKEDREVIDKALFLGRRVILCGYYNNEDKVADVINSLTKYFGIKLNKDKIFDKVNNYANDPYLIRTRNVRINDIHDIILPCPASVSGGEPLVLCEKTAKSNRNYEPIVSARLKYKNGELILVGTCSFWDNFSIDLFDNKKFALYLLNYVGKS